MPLVMELLRMLISNSNEFHWVGIHCRSLIAPNLGILERYEGWGVD